MTSNNMKPTFNCSIKTEVAQMIFREFDIGRGIIDDKPIYMARHGTLEWEITDESLTRLTIKLAARLTEAAKLYHKEMSKSG